MAGSNPLWGDFECRMLYLSERVKSFQHPEWPHGSHFALALADAGFFYMGENDRCQCCKCGLMEHLWDPKVDLPIKEHDRDSPLCEERFKQKVDDEFYVSQKRFEEEQTKNMRELSDLEMEKFKLEQLRDEEKKIQEVEEEMQKVRERQDTMLLKVCKEKELWERIDWLMKDCRENVNMQDSNFPRCSLLDSSISKEQLYMWVDKLIQNKILCGYTGERIMLASNTKTDCIRIIMSTIEKRLLSDCVKAMRLKTEVMGRMNKVVQDVLQACITTMVNYWAKVGCREGRGHSVVQRITPDQFLCMSERQMRLWFTEIYASEAISGHLYHALQHSETPKTTMAKIMSELDAIKYIQYVQLLQNVGGTEPDIVARRLGQEQYLKNEASKQAAPPSSPTEKYAAVMPGTPVKLTDTPKLSENGFQLGGTPGGLFVNRTTNYPSGVFGSATCGSSTTTSSTGFGRFSPYPAPKKPDVLEFGTPKKTEIIEFSVTNKEEPWEELKGYTFGGLDPRPVPDKKQSLLERAAELMKDLAEVMQQVKQSKDGTELF